MNSKSNKKQSEKRLAGLLFLLILFINACAVTPQDKTSYHLTIIGTADLQGALEPAKIAPDRNAASKTSPIVGGIARLATMIKTVKAETDGPVAVVSSGDDLMNRYFHTFKGKAVFQLMSEAGYEIYAFGNHEFDKGPQVLAEALGKTQWQTLCTDLNVENTPLEGLCRPWFVKDYKGLKAGFFSLMTEDFPFVTSGREVTLSKPNIAAARWAVSQLQARDVQLIVALTHIGFEQDQRLAQAVEGIDIIFGGHSHDYIPKMAKVGQTVIVNGGEKGAYLVRLGLTFNADGTFDRDNVCYALLPVTAAVSPDPEIEARLKEYQKSFPAEIVLGQTETEWNLTKDAVRRGEATVCNLVNDLMRAKFHADIVLNNAGAFRGGRKYPPGAVTDKMLKEIDEFSNYAYMLDIEGRHLKAVLERSAASFDEGGFLHPAGIRYTVDLRLTAQKIDHNASKELNVTRTGNRVNAIHTLDADGQWQPLKADKTYRVLSNSYLVNQQGDGYFWFKRYGRNLKNTYSTFYSIMAEFIGNKGILNLGKADQRIVVIEK